jgi:anhydro-N-acetylmuramic acid kinase
MGKAYRVRGLFLLHMVYKVIGLMSGSSLDGLDLAYVHLQERTGKWEYQFLCTECIPYPEEWKKRLASAAGFSALDYQLLHADYGHWLGEQVLRFMATHDLAYQVQLVVSHGHTIFHLPARRMTAQLGEGAALAAVTGINVVSDLRAMDLALGGQGAPIVPVGEKWLFGDYGFFLNLGGIANISGHLAGGESGEGAKEGVEFIAFDVCPANRVLNLLAEREGMSYDEDGALAATGQVDEDLLRRLNKLAYYGQAYPKSLANDFGTDTIYPMIGKGMRTADALRVYVEHIAVQVSEAVKRIRVAGGSGGAGASVGASESGGAGGAGGAEGSGGSAGSGSKMLVTGGGAHNDFLMGRLKELLRLSGVEVVVPERELVDYKEALVMALLGVLRWREENTVLASVTGARRNSIGGAVWIGQDI